MPVSVSVNGKDFATTMAARVARIRAGIEQTVKSVALDLHAQLVINTPIQTGQAKANWQMELGGGEGGSDSYLPDERLLRPPETIDWQAYSAEAVAAIEGYKAGQVIYVFNNLPYISALNRGSSRQAPAGFVESAVYSALNSVKQRNITS